MAHKFGQTWWGNEWLRALDQIDYSNRLPRGKSYARNGMVKDIRIDGNIISAKVQGRLIRPYRVTIVVEPFTPQQIKMLIDELLNHPTVVAMLLNRELSPTILSIARRIGLNIFPHRWKDLGMSCSCPDWAVPCKHLAAVIYMVSHEIDNNPFMVFEMHKVDLLGELAKRGITIEHKLLMELPTCHQLIAKNTKKDTTSNDDASYTPVDFSHLTNIGTSLVRLLKPEPPFYHGGDFRAVYEKAITRTARACRNVLKGKSEEAILPATDVTITHHTSITISINENLMPSVFITDITDKKKAVTEAYRLMDLFTPLEAIKIDFIDDYQPCIAALKQAMLCALHLLECGATTPLLYKGMRECSNIMWMPALLDAKVKKVIDAMEGVMPDHLVTAQFTKPKRPFSINEPAKWLVAMMMTEIVQEVNRLEAQHDDVLQLFFGDLLTTFNKVGQTETTGAVKAWLDRFLISIDDLVPTFVVDEKNNGFEMRVKVSHNIDNIAQLVDLGDIDSIAALAKKKYHIFRKLAALVTLIPALEQYIDNMGHSPMQFSLNSFTTVLIDAIPTLQMLGMKVVLPKALMKLIRPLPSIKLSTNSASKGSSFLRLDKLLNFDWQVAMGSNMVAPDEFFAMMENARGLIKFKGEYVYVNDDDLERLRKSLDAKKQLTPAQMLQASLSGTLNSVPITISDEVRQLIAKLTSMPEIALPTGLNATLRPYQERGFSWMFHNMSLGFGSIIADDMGLGKTLQVITLILELKNEGQLKNERVLIVVPTGLLTNWMAELHKFAPSITALVYHGPTRDITSFDHDVLLTSYGVMRSDVDLIKKRKWAVMVIDEAQNIKNASTHQSKAVKAVKAGVNIAMSGTPVENRLNEFWSIMEFANKGYLGSEKHFAEQFANPIQKNGDHSVAELFRKVTAPFTLRRLKTDKSIINDLPDKIEQNDMAQLTPQQASLYEETLNNAMEAITQIDDTDNAQLFKRQGLVLQMILALKQICNHPAQFIKDGNSDPNLSGKAIMLLDLVQAIVESGEKVLIFTQFKEMGELLQQIIERQLGSSPLFYHGGCSIKQRNHIVERFQNNRADRVLILSLKAASTGLNLTAATHVIHYDLWWNPAVEAQATDRAYRIGQHRNVIVHRFITKGTFEERIDEMIQSKKELANMTVATGENWIGQLSNKELNEIFSLASATSM